MVLSLQHVHFHSKSVQLVLRAERDFQTSVRSEACMITVL